MENVMKRGKPTQCYLKITATVFDVTSQQSYYQVRYKTVDGERKKIRIERELFRKPGRVVDLLLGKHANLPDGDNAIKAIKDTVLRKSSRQFRLTNRTGWYDGSFVYVTKTFGALSKTLKHEGPSDIDPALGLKKGTLTAWQNGLREPCKRSDYLIFTIAVTASGPLLELVGDDEGGIFHLQPESRVDLGNSQRKVRSSSGKTLAARVGMSTMGRCRKSDLITFAVTARGVEDYCFAHNHLAAVFDEEGRALTAGQGVKSKDLPYLVTSGVGKVRSKKATQDPNLKNLRWSLTALSTGENPLDGPGKKTARPEGAQARMIPAPVPPGDEGGIFNRVEASDSEMAKKCADLARQVETTIEANYGVLMPKYLRKLVAERPALDQRVRRLVDRFVRKVKADQDPWERRFAAKFGLALAAAVFLSEFKLAPWTEKRARKAITAIYKKARAVSVSADEAADNLINILRELVKAGERFPKLKKVEKLDAQQASRAWGAVVRLPNDERVLAVPKARLAELAKPSAITDAVVRVLCDRKLLVKSNDGKSTRQVMIKGWKGSNRSRYVCLKYKALVHHS
jgi:putative DNA primase/helicase